MQHAGLRREFLLVYYIKIGSLDTAVSAESICSRLCPKGPCPGQECCPGGADSRVSCVGEADWSKASLGLKGECGCFSLHHSHYVLVIAVQDCICAC